MLNRPYFGFFRHNEIVIPVGCVVILRVILSHSLAEFQSVLVVHENLSPRTRIHNW